ncbi:hypothetical protein M3Y99_01397700 [Aphelenchoides fujianensis]|nr:hypothetical protein M3Y99_01397700 [Aphelenchoides fujianensis]
MSSIWLVHGGYTADGRILIAGLLQTGAFGDSIDVALEDRYSELSAILETTEPLSEPDSAAVQERDGAGMRTRRPNTSTRFRPPKSSRKLGTQREEEAIPQSAELDTIVAGLTPSESEESVGSVDIEEILQKEAAEREEAQKGESPINRRTSARRSKQTEGEQQPEEPKQRPELEELIEQLTEGYDGAQQEIDAGSLGQSEDPELPEDAAADEFERPPSIEAEVQAAPPAEEPQAESTNPLSALSALHISPRPGEEGFLEDAPLSDTSNPQPAASPAVDSALPRGRRSAEGNEWIGVSEEPAGADRSKPTDEPDRADDGGQGGGEIDDSKGENGDQPPPRDDHEPPADEKPEPPQDDGEEQQQEGEKQAETSEKVELVSATPVEAAPDEAHESTASRPPPEPSAVSALLVPRSPAPFVPAAAAGRKRSHEMPMASWLLTSIAAAATNGPIESEKPAGSAEPATVGDRPPPPPAANGEQTERKARRSVDLPATPLSFHSFSSAAQLYAPVSPPLRQAIGAPEAPPPTADALKSRSIPDDSAAAAGVAPDQAGDQTDEAPRASNEVSRLLSGILTRLRHLQMTDPPKYANIVERLHALESEMSMQNTGVPPDPELTELVGRILASDYPQSDLQIVVSTSRKTTSTTQFYETETPGMVGLAPEQLRELQQKLMNKISGTTDYGTALDSHGLKHRNANEEGWTTGDGNETVTKRSIRQVTTTHSGITGMR